jgi:signal transduction histidine kinase
MLLLLFRIVQGGSAIILAQKSALETRYVEQTELLRQNEELRGRITRALYESAALSDKLMRRVGADLHDGPAQLLGLALLRLHELTPTAELERTEFARAYAEPVAAVRNHLEEAMGEIRSISSARCRCRSAVDDDRGSRAPRRPHARAADENQRAHPSRRPAGPGVAGSEACIFRSIQEGLTNAFRHAGAKGQFVGVMNPPMRSNLGQGLRTRLHRHRTSSRKRGTGACRPAP